MSVKSGVVSGKCLLLSVLFLLAGCVAPTQPREPDGPVSGQGRTLTMERPMSELPSKSEARDKAKIHVELGRAYIEAGRLGVALDESKIAVAYDRAYAPSHLLMGEVYALLEQHTEAQAAFDESLRLAPGDPEVGTSVGWYQCNRGRHKEGIARLEQAARNPYNRTASRAWTNIGLCYLQLSNDAAAKPAFQSAVLTDGDNMIAAYHLAAIAFRAGNFVGTRELVAELHRRMGRVTPETLWLAVRAERKLGNREAEQRFVIQLAKEFPASEEFRAYQQGKFE